MTETIMDLETETEEARGTDTENKKKMKNQEMRMSPRNVQSAFYGEIRIKESSAKTHNDQCVPEVLRTLRMTNHPSDNSKQEEK